MRYRDMPGWTPNRVGQPQMRCVDCLDGPYSADRGDYFMEPDDALVTCVACGGDMELGREVTQWVGAS